MLFNVCSVADGDESINNKVTDDAIRPGPQHQVKVNAFITTHIVHVYHNKHITCIITKTNKESDHNNGCKTQHNATLNAHKQCILYKTWGTTQFQATDSSSAQQQTKAILGPCNDYGE